MSQCPADREALPFDGVFEGFAPCISRTVNTSAPSTGVRKPPWLGVARVSKGTVARPVRMVCAMTNQTEAVDDRPDEVERVIGCLLGGAVGDALGAGVEFDSWQAITRRFGPQGVTDFVPAYGHVGAITDDTQMTMFTTEGLIRGHVRRWDRGIGYPPTVVRHAYLRWLWTQGDGGPLMDAFGLSTPDGWLAALPALQSRRAPGNTCIGALSMGGDGSVAAPINQSKGCGGVMRAAPAGFEAFDVEEQFLLGCEIAAITHGHPSGYLPAGFLATVVGALLDRVEIGDALDVATEQLCSWDGHEETLAMVTAGRQLGHRGLPSPNDLDRFGAGWTGHEALGIAVACVVSEPAFDAGVLAAVNHSGDSDSTGSITGNILGTAYGTASIPAHWRERVELHDQIDQLARDAVFELRQRQRTGTQITDPWRERYPGW